MAASSLARALVLLSAGLLLGGCTISPTTPDGSAPSAPLTETVPSPSRAPVGNAAPSTSPSAAGFDLVTIDDEGYGLRPASEDPAAVVAWAEQYCKMASLSPCTGIEDRGAPLCIEKWDCHPALLVEFEEGAAAFVSGGIFPDPRVFAVWHPASAPAVEEYGGARALLEAYLLTVGVCPDEHGGSPRGRTCGLF